jgi:hypothetical protein
MSKELKDQIQIELVAFALARGEAPTPKRHRIVVGAGWYSEWKWETLEKFQGFDVICVNDEGKSVRIDTDPWKDLAEVMKQTYLSAFQQFLNNSSTMLKYIEKDDSN